MKTNRLKLGVCVVLLNVLVVVITHYIPAPPNHFGMFHAQIDFWQAVFDLITSCVLLSVKRWSTAAVFMACGLALIWLVSGA
jgi:hypothetical protein